MNEKDNLNLIKESKELTQEQTDVITGTLLGDSYIRKNPAKSRAYISFCQGINNTDYLFSLFKILQSFCNMTEPSKSENFDKRYNKIRYAYYFCTTLQVTLLPFANLFLSETLNDAGNPTKIIPTCIGELLTPRALAY
jgi:hypothetical protein